MVVILLSSGSVNGNFGSDGKKVVFLSTDVDYTLATPSCIKSLLSAYESYIVNTHTTHLPFSLLIANAIQITLQNHSSTQ
jgi:hypothetical protein